MEEIEARHKKERKELQAKILSLKKNSGKSKKKKEFAEEIVRLEAELDKRHEDELTKFGKNITTSDNNGVDEISEQTEDLLVSDGMPKPPKPSKAQRRREKKENEEKARKEELQVAEKDNINGPRQREIVAIKKILASRKLRTYSIPSDGDCLYGAIKHQMKMVKNISYDISELRRLAAEYITNNKDSLIFYMTNPETSEQLSDAEFDEYCDAVRCTKAWGGQIEIKAISNSLKVPIEIIQATGPSTVQGVDEFQPPNLIITYHRHIYSLGEHYDSTQPSQKAEDYEDS